MHEKAPKGIKTMIGPLWFLLFVNELPDGLEAQTLLFADDAKMITPLTHNMNLHSSLFATWDWSQKWDLPANPAKCKYLTIGREVPLRLYFSPDGSGTPIPASKLVKDLEIQAGNVFSPSAQCTAATNEARRVIFMIRRSFQDLSKSAFILSASTP